MKAKSHLLHKMTKPDRYERELLEAFETGRLKSVATKAELEKLKASARTTAVKDRKSRPSRQLAQPKPHASGRRVDVNAPPPDVAAHLCAEDVVMDFYDQLAPFYHLVHQDWNASVLRQGHQLDGLIAAQWPGGRKLLDVTCGIGTQALALAMKGYSVTASDLSRKEVERARSEAGKRGLEIEFSVCDVRQAHTRHGSGFDVVISCDNSLPHLLTDQDLVIALQQMLACLAVGGGCVVTVRDYALEERGTNLVRPYGVRIEDGKRYLLFQVWDFDGAHYDLTFFFVEEDLASHEVRTHAMRSRYYAISTDRLSELMREAGFEDVRRIDGVFYQPVLVGTRAA